MATCIYNTIEKHLAEKKNFAAYRLPGSSSINLLELGNGQEFHFNMVDKPPASKGFVVFPFNPEREKGWWYNVNSEITRLIELPAKPSSLTWTKSKLTNGLAEYQRQFNQMKLAIEEGEVKKVILSREIIKNGNHYHLLPRSFYSLCNSFPDTFSYLISTHDTGTWIGASPEILLTKQGGNISTVALAGTIKNSDGQHGSWGDKELDEQGIVGTYIEKILKESGVTKFEKIGPNPINAGNVTHLKTTYQFAQGNLEGNLARFLEALHPTPALCGHPKERALSVINRVETHDRSYYGGFLGSFNRDEINLFVNIRCMKIASTHASIFVGGGLTGGSCLENEWKETILKSELMLSLLEQGKALYKMNEQSKH